MKEKRKIIIWIGIILLLIFEVNAGNFVTEIQIGDSTPPVISNIVNTSITYTSVLITWNTDEASNSTIYYSYDTNTNLTKSDSTMDTSHSISLTGLDIGTDYYYNVSSCDISNNCDINEQYSFTTLNDTSNPLLDLSYPLNSSTITSSPVPIIFTLTDDTLSSCNLTFNGEEGYENKSVSSGSNSFSSISLSNGNYNYSILCTDLNNNFNQSDTYEFSISISTTSTGGSGGGSYNPYIDDLNISYNELWETNSTQRIIVTPYENNKTITIYDMKVALPEGIIGLNATSSGNTWVYDVFVEENSTLGIKEIEVIANGANQYRKKISVEVTGDFINKINNLTNNRFYTYVMLGLSGLVLFTSYDRRRKKWNKSWLLFIPFVLLAFNKSFTFIVDVYNNYLKIYVANIWNNLIIPIGIFFKNLFVYLMDRFMVLFDKGIVYMGDNQIANKIKDLLPFETSSLFISLVLVIITVILIITLIGKFKK